MRTSIAALCFLTVGLQTAFAQTAHANSPAAGRTKTEQDIVSLSKDKWLWMAERKVDSLDALFHDEAFFTHMGGTWGKTQEIDIIKSGRIHYKKADIQDVSVRVIGQTAIVLDKIRLTAVVGGNEVVNPFMVTEVYLQQGGTWKLVQLSFSRLAGE